LLELLLIAADFGLRFVEVHVDFDAAGSRCKRAQAGSVLDDGVDVYRHVTRISLPREEQKIADHADRTIGLALDEAHRFELLTLQLVLEQQLREGGDSGKRIVELVCNTGNELADGGELLGPSQVICNLALLGEIPNTDDEADDLVVWIQDMAEGNGSRKFSSVLSAVNVLTTPECFIGRYDWNSLSTRKLRRRNHEIVD